MSVSEQPRLAAMPGKPPSRRSRRARAGPLAIALAGLVAGAAGCGSDGDGSIPPDVSDGLLSRVEAVEQSVEAGDCDLAQQQAEELVSDVGELPGEVEAEVERGLVDGATQLAELTRTQCEPITGATGLQETEPIEPAPEEEPPEEEQADDEDEGEDEGEEPEEGEDSGEEGEQPPADGGEGEESPTTGEGGGGEPPTGGTEPDTGGIIISPDSGSGSSEGAP
jgi:hypothetical protein